MGDNNISNSSMLKVGTILHGTYRIDGYLSSGGFGNTYVATKVEFGEKYAIKEFFMRGVSQRDSNNTTVSVSNVENETAFASQLEKFKKEARRLRTLNSEHIVKVYDLFDENGTSYYVMDYIEGESLSQWLKRTGKHMSEKRVLQILPQILDALEVAHNEGILHLDLKPANIMMDKLGNVKLIDFGASKQQSMSGGATSTSAIAYSKGYAPREQMEQNPKKFGPWTDFYALGATLYNLLTNKKPPLSSDIDDDTSIDKHEALPMPSTISYKTKQLIIWLMATNRNKRPQSVTDIRYFLLTKADSTRTNKSETLTHNTTEDIDEETIILNNTSKIKSNSKVVRVNRTITFNGFHWFLISVELQSTCTIFKWRVYCNEKWSYIYNNGKEYIKDQDTGKKYTIIQSVGTGTPNNPIFLREADKVIEFLEIFTPLPTSVSIIDYYMGKGFVLSNIDLKHSVDPNDDPDFANYPLQDGLTLREVNDLAEKQDVDAQVLMANCYYFGKVVPKVYTNAVRWFRQAAEKGNSYAEYMLASCYFYGDGVSMDRGQAVVWYRKAAEHGNAKAENDLGICYENGYGVIKDYEEAKKWYNKAISNGYDKARANLDSLGNASYSHNSNPKRKKKHKSLGSQIWNGLKILCGGIVILLAILAKGGRKVEKALPKIEENIPRAGYIIDKEVRNNNQTNVEDDSTASPSDYYPTSTKGAGSNNQSKQVW